MLNLPLFARVCLLLGVVLGGGFYASVGEADAAEFRSISAGSSGDRFRQISVSAISGDGTKIGGLVSSNNPLLDCANLACWQTGFLLSIEEKEVVPIPLPSLPVTLPNQSLGNGAALNVVALSYDGNIAVVNYDLRDDYRSETLLVHDGEILALRERVSQEDVLRATDISSDGSVVIGVTRSTAYEPFRWTESSGLQSLSGIGSDSHYGPVAISGDGKVVLLNDRSSNLFLLSNRINQNAIRWNEIDGSQELLPLPEDDYSHVTKASFDGSVIVGASFLAADLTSQATVWREGSPTLLELPNSYVSSYAIDVSANGQSIIGTAQKDITGLATPSVPIVNNAFPTELPLLSPTRQPQAILWRDGEAFVLQDLLMEQYGLANELAGWRLTSATAISDDGTVIAGQGIDPDGFSAAWVATLVIPEPAALTLLLCLWMPMAVGRRRC